MAGVSHGSGVAQETSVSVLTQGVTRGPGVTDSGGGSGAAILTESGVAITTEGGSRLETEGGP